MVATAPLAEVVEEPREIEELRLGQALEDLAAERQLCGVLGQRHAPQVAHHEQGVLVHGVGVEEVVLHLPLDLAEGGQIGAEHPVAVHAPQLVRDAARLAQQLHEQAARAQVRAEALVDEVQVLADQAYGRGAHAGELRVLGEQQEDLEQGEGMAAEDAGVARLDEAVAHLEAPPERCRRARLAAVQDLLLEVLEQHLVEAREGLHRAVVAFHELLDGEVGVVVAVAEAPRQLGLVVEEQAVLAPAREQVQADADAPQQRLALGELAVLALGEEAVGDQLVQVPGAVVALGHPADHLDVAQPARALLDVGLELVGGVVEAVVARLLLAPLGGEEGLAGPDPLRPGRLAHGAVEGLVAGERARLHQVGGHRDVARRLLHALGHRAHAVADVEAQVPQQRPEALHGRAPVRATVVLGHEDHEVHVGARHELAAAVAAHGDEGEAPGVRAEAPPPQGAQELVHLPRAAVDELRGGGAGLEGGAQGLVHGGEGGARRFRLGKAAREGLLQHRQGRGQVPGACGGGAAHGRGGSQISPSSARSVRTSQPSSVTSTVCSHCAERLWSLVTTVQPSASSFTWRLPALIMGSMVKVMPGCRTSPVPGRP